MFLFFVSIANVFETKQTRSWRKALELFSKFIIFILGYSLLSYGLILYSQNENVKTKETFYKKRPDIIVVFTGDRGRIQEAIRLAKEYNQENILISGVHTKNNVSTLIQSHQITDEINHDFLDIDYNAKNTYENVLETLQALRKKSNIDSVLIVSHDYHILRIKSIIEYRRRENDHYKFYFWGVKSPLNSFRSLKIIYKEVFKYFRTLTYLAVASED